MRYRNQNWVCGITYELYIIHNMKISMTCVLAVFSQCALHTCRFRFLLVDVKRSCKCISGNPENITVSISFEYELGRFLAVLLLRRTFHLNYCSYIEITHACVAWQNLKCIVKQINNDVCVWHFKYNDSLKSKYKS
jgi:hypothetical protein